MLYTLFPLRPSVLRLLLWKYGLDLKIIHLLHRMGARRFLGECSVQAKVGNVWVGVTDDDVAAFWGLWFQTVRHD